MSNYLSIHGSLDKLICNKCSLETKFDHNKIKCSSCQKIMKPNIVFYEDKVREIDLLKLYLDFCDLIIITKIYKLIQLLVW